MMDPIMEELALKHELRDAIAPKIRELWGEPFEIDITDIDTFANGGMLVYADIELPRGSMMGKFTVMDDMYVARAEKVLA